MKNRMSLLSMSDSAARGVPGTVDNGDNRMPAMEQEPWAREEGHLGRVAGVSWTKKGRG